MKPKQSPEIEHKKLQERKFKVREAQKKNAAWDSVKPVVLNWKSPAQS